VMSVHSTCAATERNGWLWGRVYTSVRNALGLKRAEESITSSSMTVRMLLIRMTFGLLLSVVEGGLLKGTGWQVDEAEAADVIEGQGSDKEVSSTSALWVTQALICRELVSRHCESEVVFEHVHSICRQLRKTHTHGAWPETNTEVLPRIIYGCLGVDWCNVYANWLVLSFLRIQ
jgi:hypothetical protein